MISEEFIELELKKNSEAYLNIALNKPYIISEYFKRDNKKFLILNSFMVGDLYAIRINSSVLTLCKLDNKIFNVIEDIDSIKLDNKSFKSGIEVLLERNFKNINYEIDYNAIERTLY